MNLQKNHFEPQKMQLVMTLSLQRRRVYFQKRTLAFVWISKWQLHNIFPRFGLFRRPLATGDAGVIDADYRGSVEVLLMNHHPHEVYTIRTGDRIGQIVFTKKYYVTFKKVSDPALLGRKKRGSGGFGSTGSSGNKIFVSTVKDQVIFESASVSVNDKVIIDISNIDKIIINSDPSESNSDNSEEINYFFVFCR